MDQSVLLFVDILQNDMSYEIVFFFSVNLDILESDINKIIHENSCIM